MADFSRARENVDWLKQRREQHYRAVGGPRSLGSKRGSFLHVTAGQKQSSPDAQKLANALQEIELSHKLYHDKFKVNALKERRYSPVKQVELSHKLYHDKLKASSDLSIGEQSPTSRRTELTESSSPSSSTLESVVKLVLDEEDESEQVMVVNLKEFFIWQRQPPEVVEDYETLSVSINTAETHGSNLYFQEKDTRHQDVKGQHEGPRVQRKVSTQSNKGQRERPRAQITPSVESKKAEAKRKVEAYFQRDKTQRDRQESSETDCMPYSRSSDQDTLVEVDEHIDGAARLREMYGREVNKLRQQDMLGLQYRSARHRRECRNRRLMQSQKKPQHKMKHGDLDHKDRRDVLAGMRAETGVMKKQVKDKDGNRRLSRRANRLSIIDDCESEAKPGGLAVNQSTTGVANTNLGEPTLSEDESIDSVEIRFVSQKRRSWCFDEGSTGEQSIKDVGDLLITTVHKRRTDLPSK
jgi:hypothetical protein